MMKNKIAVFAAVVLLSGSIAANRLLAEETPVEKTSPAAPTTEAVTPSNLASTYTDKGADTCIKCHDEDSEFPVFSIFKTKHAQQADARTPFANLQCETCHGPGAEHANKVPPGEKQAAIIAFGATSKLSADKLNPVSAARQSQICLTCHQGNDHIGWQGSVHDNADTSCTDCHSVHTPHDAVLAKKTQPDVCFTCHKKERADFFKTSTHPVRAGLITCTECHKPHGAGADKLLSKPTVNQSCYTCHAEKRGPFLWEHAPVSEDCTLCHTPHGSIHKALLTKSPPLLCQQCHAAAGHPAVARTGAALPGGGSSPSSFLLVGSCNNCHSQVHGSNHPSGVKGMR